MMKCLLVVFCVLALCSDWTWGKATPMVDNDDVDEFLNTINNAVQMKGKNYHTLVGNITIEDAVFEGIKIGELSTWKRDGNTALYATGFNNFTLQAKVYLGVFHFHIDNMITGTYSGALSGVAMTNTVLYTLKVSNRFQKGLCQVELDGFTNPQFKDIRLYTPDNLAAGFFLEKQYIVDLIVNHYKDTDGFKDILDYMQNIAEKYLCQGMSTSTQLAEFL